MNSLVFEWYKKDEQSVNLISCISTHVHLPDNLLNAHILRLHSELSQ